MALFSLSRKSHILVLSGEQAIAARQTGKHLDVAAWFEAAPEGPGAFARYLAKAPRWPLTIVADMIEEDFRSETVPHALGSDHKALVERKFAQLFHNTPYRCARRQERQRTGRRDDRILFSALTNADHLSCWIDPVLAMKLPVAGITSAAQLTEAFVRRMPGGDAPHVLLVSHQPHSGLRQTYLRKGRLAFSRLTPYVARPEKGRDDRVIDQVIEECRRTRQYLDRQRLIRNDETLDIHVCSEPEDLDRFTGRIDGPPLQRFHVHDLAAETGANGPRTTPKAIGAFTRCLLHTGRFTGLPNHYAPANVIRYRRIAQLRAGLAYGAALLALTTGATVMPLVSGGFKDLALKQRLDNEARQYMERYTSLRRDFPTVPVPAEAMRQAVDTINTLRQLPSPLHVAAPLSLVLNGLPEIRIDRFSWKMEKTDPDTPAASAETIPTGGAADAPTTAVIAAMIEGRSRMTALVGGTIHPYTGQRAAHESLNRLIAAVEAVPGLKATLLEVPLETTPGATIKTRLGQEGNDPRFAIQIENTAP